MAGATISDFVHYEDQLLHKQNQRWQLLCILLSVSLGLALIALVILAHRPRARPYVIAIDGAKGEPLGLVAPLANDSMAVQDTVTRWAIEQFIKNAKTVTPDIPQQKEHLFDAYAFVKTQAHDELDAYYHDPQSDRIPFDIAKKSWIQVSNIRVLKLPAPDTWQADWTEVRTDYNTTVEQVSRWRATLKLVNDDPTDRNPLGLYISTLDWAEEQQSE
jgi:type IV secretion system protein TrbF